MKDESGGVSTEARLHRQGLEIGLPMSFSEGKKVFFAKQGRTPRGVIFLGIETMVLCVVCRGGRNQQELNDRYYIVP